MSRHTSEPNAVWGEAVARAVPLHGPATSRGRQASSLTRYVARPRPFRRSRSHRAAPEAVRGSDLIFEERFETPFEIVEILHLEQAAEHRPSEL